MYYNFYILQIIISLILFFLLLVLNCVRLLSRILPYIFEEPDWRGFFWSSLPGKSGDDTDSEVKFYLNVLPHNKQLFF